jgi:hypothetical protein
MKAGTFDVCLQSWYMYNEETVVLKFKTICKDAADDFEFPWFMSLKEIQPGKKVSAQEITFKNLYTCGWNGDIEVLANPEAGKGFDGLDLVAEIKADPKSKYGFSVASVYRKGQPPFRKMDPESAKAVLGGMKGAAVEAKKLWDKEHASAKKPGLDLGD